MSEVQLKVKVASSLKEEATLKAKAEGITMKQLIETLLVSYVRGEQEVVPITPSPPKEETTSDLLTPNDFDNYLEYVDYLERMGKI